ncbi:hypothetical protein ACI2KR_27095 [Pseudomonas luteola]
MNSTEPSKLRRILYAKLVGMASVDPSYLVCLKAFDYAELHHTGVRKDKVTPEINHQHNILGFMLTQIRNLSNPAIVLAVIMLHDTLEDNGELEDEIKGLFPDLFVYIRRISKVRRGIKLSNELYYSEMAECPVSSVGKGADRAHNLSTSLGVLSNEKLEEALTETRQYVLPMLKKARHNFPEQEMIYELIKSVINIQLHNIEQYLKVTKPA